jgi:hypothetical protein
MHRTQLTARHANLIHVCVEPEWMREMRRLEGLRRFGFDFCPRPRRTKVFRAASRADEVFLDAEPRELIWARCRPTRGDGSHV